MGIFDRWKHARTAPAPEQTTQVATQSPEPEWRDEIWRYRDPMHPERTPHPKKVARSIYASNTLTLDPETIARECEIAGVDPAPVHAELDAIRAREVIDASAERTGFRTKTRTLNFDPATVADLRPLGGKSWKAVGAGNCLSDRERDALQSGWFVLRREPDNPYDANAVAVYLDCRKVGYLTAAKAKTYSPILAAIEAQGFEVDGQIVGRSAHIQLPAPSSLRTFAAPLTDTK